MIPPSPEVYRIMVPAWAGWSACFAVWAGMAAYLVWDIRRSAYHFVAAMQECAHGKGWYDGYCARKQGKVS